MGRHIDSGFMTQGRSDVQFIKSINFLSLDHIDFLDHHLTDGLDLADFYDSDFAWQLIHSRKLLPSFFRLCLGCKCDTKERLIPGFKDARGVSSVSIHIVLKEWQTFTIISVRISAKCLSVFRKLIWKSNLWWKARSPPNCSPKCILSLFFHARNE